MRLKCPEFVQHLPNAFFPRANQPVPPGTPQKCIITFLTYQKMIHNDEKYKMLSLHFDVGGIQICKGKVPLFNPVGIRVQRGKKNAVLRDQSFQVVDSPSSFTRMPCASEFI